MSDDAIIRFTQGIKAQEDQGRANANVFALRNSSPDQAARANVVARSGGLPFDVVDRNLDETEGMARSNNAQQWITRYPAIGHFFADPRAAAVGIDDIPSLAKTSAQLQSLVGSTDDTVTAGVRQQAGAQSNANQSADGFASRAAALGRRGFSQLESGLYELGGALHEWSADNPLPWTDRRSIDADRATAQQLRTRAQLLSGTAPIRGETTWADLKAHPSLGRIASFGTEQTIAALPSMGAAIVSLPGLVASMSGSFGQSRAQNDGRADASIGDVAEAAPAALAASMLDRLGISRVFGATGSTVARRIGQGVATEAATQGAQSGVTYAGETLGTNKGFHVTDALDQVASGAVMGAFLGGGMRGAHEAAARLKSSVSTALATNQAYSDAAAMDGLMKMAADNKVRQRDPELFGQFVDQHTAGTSAEHVYIPAELCVADFA